MRLLLINPNTSADMTERIAAEARRHCVAGTDIVPVTAAFGCEVIASRASYAIAAHAALDAYAKHAVGIDAVVLACFGDPGLQALREIASVPVIGLLESAVADAARSHRAFAIVTSGRAWVPMLEEQVRLSTYAAGFRGVFAIDATGLAVSRDHASALPQLQRAVDSAVSADSQAIVLGGSSMAGLGSRLSSPVELIDPLATAVTLAQQANRIGPSCPRPALLSSGLSPALSRILATRGDLRKKHRRSV